MSTQSSSAGARGAAAPLEHVEQLLHWSTWSSGFLGAQRAALLEHMEQRLSESGYRSSSGALWSSSFPGTQRSALLEHVEQRLSGSRYSGSTGANGARGAAALWEQIQVFLGAAAFPEHTEQLCWYTCSSGATESSTREVLLHMFSSKAALCAPCAPA